MFPIRRIVHPTDFSQASRPALAVAIEMAKQYGAELTVIHVISLPLRYVDAATALERKVRTQMASVMKKISRAGAKAKSLVPRGTAPIDDEIVRASKTRRADLIVMGTHGRAGASKFFLGSVASRVIANAHCPVMTIRGR